jgi:penicillin-binding protein 1A
VWVGFDQGKALGLPGSKAALPIWADFMKMATAGRPESPFVPPPGIVIARIDPETGGLATALCPQAIDEAFPSALVPATPCPEHPVWATGDETPADRRPAGSPGRGERRWAPWPF